MKKLIAWILLLTMVMGLFAGCNQKKPDPTNPPTTTAPAEATIEDAIAYLKAIYKDEGAKTPVDYKRFQIVRIAGIPFEVEMQGSSLVEADLPTQTPIEGATPAAAPATPAPAASPAAPAAGPGAGNPVKAPLPGVVTKVLVAAGQAVKKGDTVLVLEAMKMENNITAESDGSVTGICVAPGDSVMEGTVLLTIG